MGVLSMFGLEASVFMLTLMTLNRLHIICRPFKSPDFRKASTIISSLLFISLLLAIVPIFPVAKDYFVSHVRLRRNPFLERDIDRGNFSRFVNDLASYGVKHDFRGVLGQKQDLYSWNSLYSAMKQLNESFEPKFEFGYYSSHGVCLPKFFPTFSDPAWQYSIFLIIINFVSFFVILIAYIGIYKRTTKTRMKAGKNENQSSQNRAIERKITRIIVTDFICWMPICVIAFLKIQGVEISGDVYAIAAIIILPINSAINPFLYSNLPDAILSRAGKAYSYMQSDQARSRETDQTATANGNGSNGTSGQAVQETKQ